MVYLCHKLVLDVPQVLMRETSVSKKMKSNQAQSNIFGVY